MTLHSNQNINEVESETQLYMIVNHLLTLGPRKEPFTVLYAITHFGCFALSQRIGELKRMGFPIQSEWHELENGKRVMKYWL